jgi:hypothetical protein
MANPPGYRLSQAVKVTSHPAPDRKSGAHHRQPPTQERHGERSMKIENVMERVYERRRLSRAWQQVEKNAGAAGIDQMTVEDFATRKGELLDLIYAKLEAGTYRFKPARRVLIPKPGTTKKRKLGIPVVMDRIVSQSLYTVLEEIFDPDFTKSNFVAPGQAWDWRMSCRQ